MLLQAVALKLDRHNMPAICRGLRAARSFRSASSDAVWAAPFRLLRHDRIEAPTPRLNAMGPERRPAWWSGGREYFGEKLCQPFDRRPRASSPRDLSLSRLSTSRAPAGPLRVHAAHHQRSGVLKGPSAGFLGVAPKVEQSGATLKTIHIMSGQSFHSFIVCKSWLEPEGLAGRRRQPTALGGL